MEQGGAWGPAMWTEPHSYTRAQCVREAGTLDEPVWVRTPLTRASQGTGLDLSSLNPLTRKTGARVPSCLYSPHRVDMGHENCMSSYF